MSDCVHCTHEIQSAEEACGWCGLWQNGHMPMCETHPTAPSIGLCVVCARPVCGTCAQRSDGRLFCDDRTHQAFAADHTLIGSFDSEFDADWVAVMLSRAGIPSYVHSFRDHVSSWWFPLPSAARVFISTSRVAEARAVLADVDDLPQSP